MIYYSEHLRIAGSLKAVLREAEEEYDAITTRQKAGFEEIVLMGLCCRENNRALEKYIRALRRYSNFILEGIVPDDLQRLE